jgi:hypothetical protein
VRDVLGAVEARAESLAFVIARAIGRRGLRPRPVLSAPEVQAYARARLNSNLLDAMLGLLRGR